MKSQKNEAQSLVTKFSGKEAYCRGFEVGAAAHTVQEHPQCVHNVYHPILNGDQYQKDGKQGHWVSVKTWILSHSNFYKKASVQFTETLHMMHVIVCVHVLFSCCVGRWRWMLCFSSTNTRFKFCCGSIHWQLILPWAALCFLCITICFFNSSEKGGWENWGLHQ